VTWHAIVTRPFPRILPELNSFPSTVRHPFMIGQRLGHWIIDADRGADTLGRLFLVHDADDPARTALLKAIDRTRGHDGETIRLFLAQVELLRKLQHPGILAVIEGSHHEGQLFVVMADPGGTDCATLLRQGEKFGWEETLRIGLTIVPALRHAHRRSVLHRDLRPGTLYRCGDGRYRLAEFGISKFFADTQTGSADDTLGPAAYLSPEQATGKPHTKRSDFYSLGGLLYTLIAGRPPFTGATLVELTHKQCYALPERPIHFVHDMPEELDRYVMRLLAKDPGQRPGSGTLLVQELEGIWSMLERRGTVGRRPPAMPDGDSAAEPLDDVPVPPPLMPRPLPREETPLLRRWYVVVPVFAACVLLLLWAFFWRGPSADELMSRARPLLESDQPGDWDRAWNEYLEPLSRRYPDKFTDEVREARQRIDQQGELKRALVAGTAVRYRSDAERFYYQGLALLRAGDWPAARRIWMSVTTVYRGNEDAEKWVALATEGIARIDARDRPAENPRTDAALQALLSELNRLHADGNAAQASKLLQAAQVLYRDEPALETLRAWQDSHK